MSVTIKSLADGTMQTTGVGDLVAQVAGTKAIRLVSCEKAVVENNTTNLIDHPSNDPIEFMRSNVLCFFNNRNSVGELVLGVNEDTGRRIDELETRIEDALLMSL